MARVYRSQETQGAVKRLLITMAIAVDAKADEC
jgi:hypothetical protein